MPPTVPTETPDPAAGARAKKLILIGLLTAGLFIGVVPVIAESFRTTIPTFGFKLSKLPVIGILFRSRTLSAVDVAFDIAIVLFVCVCFAWRAVLRAHLYPPLVTNTDTERYRKIVTPAAVVLLLCDAAFFYIGLAGMTWGKLGFSLPAALVTVTMSLVTVFVSLMSLKFEADIKELEG